jgi:hypothetical protein
MNCTRMEELIPLYVGGDLGERSASGVRSHLQACAACRELAAEYEASQAWLRAAEPPDFDDAFVDTIRAGVMGKLSASEPARPFAERLQRWFAPRRLATAFALVVICVALALVVYWSRSRVNHQDDRVAKEAPAPGVEKTEDGKKPATGVNPIPVKQAKRRTPRRNAPLLAKRSRRDGKRAAPPQDHLVARHPFDAMPGLPTGSSGAATGSAETLRIEIQTADPNIRIIWFAPKQTPGEATKPMGDTL